MAHLSFGIATAPQRVGYADLLRVAPSQIPG